MASNEFIYKGRIIYRETLPNKEYAFGYVTTSQTEADRIKNKYGQLYVIPYPGDKTGTKNIIALGKSVNNGKDLYTYPSGNDKSAKLNGITNFDLVTEIANDPNVVRNLKGQSGDNTTTIDPNSPGGGSSSPISQPNTPQLTPRTVRPLTYPSDMKDDQDRIKFTAHTYQSGLDVRTGGGSFGELKPVNFTPVDTGVILSIQSPIGDQNLVGWEPDTMNPIEMEFARLSKKLMDPNTNITGASIEEYNRIIGESKKQEQSIQTYLIGQAVGINNLQSRLMGQVLNPNLELLFQGPQLRPFNFTFKMSARNQGEANQIKAIIKYFKQNMAVRKDNNIFLKAPNVFKIEYQYGAGNEHKGLNLIKKMCALTNCSVDYTPLGTYMTYNDGTMVAYSMSLAFQELEPLYDTDYDEQHPIGH